MPPLRRSYHAEAVVSQRLSTAAPTARKRKRRLEPVDLRLTYVSTGFARALTAPPCRSAHNCAKLRGVTDALAKGKLRALAKAATSEVSATARGLESLRGIALYDTRKDDVFTSLPTFTAAESALASLPLLHDRYGVSEARRITLQFVYEWLDRLTEPRFDEAVFEALWEDFAGELDEPDWVYRGLTNIRWFDAEGDRFDFDEGVSIRGSPRGLGVKVARQGPREQGLRG